MGDPSQYVLSSHAWLEASSSDGVGSSTNGAPSVDANCQYACEDWVSRLSAKKIG